jgi:hypothetical protein
MRRNAAAIGVTAALALVVTGCAGGPANGGAGPSGAGPTGAVLIDADRFGAIVLDVSSGEYRGVSRAGTVVWRLAAAAGPALVICLARCPDAALSGSAAAMGEPDAPDPQPRVVVGGAMRPVTTALGVKRSLVAAANQADYVLAGGDRADGWWLEFRHGTGLPPRVTVAGYATSWQASADGRWALAVTTVAGDSAPRRAQAQWFSQGPNGWRPSGAAKPVSGASSCVSPAGDWAVLVGASPAVLARRGGAWPVVTSAAKPPQTAAATRPVTDLAYISACGLAATGGILAEYAQHAGTGLRSRLRVIDETAATVWRGEELGEAGVTADPTSARVAFVAGGMLHEIDARTGRVLRVIAGVAAGRYDEAGSIVLVRASGEVEWSS